MSRGRHGTRPRALRKLPDHYGKAAARAFDILEGGEWEALSLSEAGMRALNLQMEVRSDGDWTPLELSDQAGAPEWPIGRIGSDAWLGARKQTIADYLRSDEPIAPQFRKLLADAIDGQGDPAVRIELRKARTWPLMVSILEQPSRDKEALDTLETFTSAGLSYADARAETAKALGTNERDLADRLAFAALVRDRIADFNDAKTPDDAINLMLEPLPAPRRGRRPKGDPSRE